MRARLSWWRLLRGQGEVPVEHLCAHAALLLAESSRQLRALERRLLLTLLAGLLLACGIVLAGMAAMLWLLAGSPLPGGGSGFPPGLLVVPVLPLLAALWTWRLAGRRSGPPPFEVVRDELAADLVAWRQASLAAGAGS